MLLIRLAFAPVQSTVQPSPSSLSVSAPGRHHKPARYSGARTAVLGRDRVRLIATGDMYVHAWGVEKHLAIALDFDATIVALNQNIRG